MTKRIRCFWIQLFWKNCRQRLQQAKADQNAAILLSWLDKAKHARGACWNDSYRLRHCGISARTYLYNVTSSISRKLSVLCRVASQRKSATEAAICEFTASAALRRWSQAVLLYWPQYATLAAMYVMRKKISDPRT